LKPTIDVSAGNECAFRGSTENGHLEIAQWLLSVKPSIDISSENEYAFRWSCRKGYLNIAQWLLSVKPTIDISAELDCAFRGSCRNGYLNVAQWLLELQPDKYELIIANNKIISYSVKKSIVTLNVVTVEYSSKEEVICPICYDEEKLIQFKQVASMDLQRLYYKLLQQMQFI